MGPGCGQLLESRGLMAGPQGGGWQDWGEGGVGALWVRGVGLPGLCWEGSPGVLPLVSQSWKEAVPPRLVRSPPPQGKQLVRPGSGWYVPTGQAWHG